MHVERYRWNMKQVCSRYLCAIPTVVAVGLAVMLAGCGSGAGPTDLGAGDGPTPRRAAAASPRPAVRAPSNDLLRAER